MRDTPDRTEGALPWWRVAFDAYGGALDERRRDQVARDVRAADLRHLIVLAHSAQDDTRRADQVDARCRALIESVGHTDGVGVLGVRWPSLCLNPEDGGTTEAAEEGTDGRQPSGVTDAELDALRRVFPDSGDALVRVRDLLRERPGPDSALDDLGIALRRLAEQPLHAPLHAYAADLGADALPQTDPAMLIDSTAQVCQGFAEALDLARREHGADRGDEAPTGTPAPSASHHGTLSESDAVGPRAADDPTSRLTRPESLAPSERPWRAEEAAPTPGRVWDGARQLLCQVVSYATRRHAGLIGERGLAPLLRDLGEESPGTRVHLVGHGAGARLVAFAARGLGSEGPGAASVCLFQAALSHFVFAEHLPQLSGGGALAGLSARVAGPVVCCYSRHDLELGVFFPLATRRIGDGALLTGAGRLWGALGHDGIQGLDGCAALTLAEALEEGALPSSGYVGVDASQRVREGEPPRGAHHDVFHEDLARLVRAAGRLAEGP
ncbi:hypothetical protein RB200_29460 [Streptomyces sp. PmtG]